MSFSAFALLTLSSAALPEIANPGFEQVNESSGAPAGWYFTSLPGEGQLVRYAAEVVAAGEAARALSIAVAADHPEQKVAYNAHQDITGFATGKTYRLSAKVRTKGLKTLPMIVVQCVDAGGRKHLAMARSPERTLDADLGEWESIHADVTVPEGTSVMRLRIGIPSEGNAGGTALIDDISIAEAK